MAHIQIATLEDLDALSVLFDAYRVFYEQKTDITASRIFLQARIQNQESVIFTYKDEAGKMLGFIQLYPIFSSTRLRRLWLLNDLYVSEKARGQGISIMF